MTPEFLVQRLVLTAHLNGAIGTSEKQTGIEFSPV